jgi:hypothetical protein
MKEKLEVKVVRPTENNKVVLKKRMSIEEVCNYLNQTDVVEYYDNKSFYDMICQRAYYEDVKSNLEGNSLLCIKSYKDYVVSNFDTINGMFDMEYDGEGFYDENSQNVFPTHDVYRQDLYIKMYNTEAKRFENLSIEWVEEDVPVIK